MHYCGVLCDGRVCPSDYPSVLTSRSSITTKLKFSSANDLGEIPVRMR